MKHYNKILLLAVAAGMAVSCADAPFVEYKTEKPESLTKYEYLNEYGALKTYIDRTAHPGFKLGTGITASEFVKQDLVYSLAVSNYDDVTAGNAMKYSSIVADNGNMDFGTVKKFVKTAKEAELSIYGHTLCWHSQQNNKWLNSLIAGKEIEVDPNEMKEVTDVNVDFSIPDVGKYFWKGIPETASIEENAAEGCYEIKNQTVTAENYNVQYHTTGDNLPLVKDKEYKLKMMIKGSGEGQLSVAVGPWGEGTRTENEWITFDTEWKEYEFSFKAVNDGGHVMTQSGKFAGTIQIKYVKITHEEPVGPATYYESIITNGDAEGDDLSCFFATQQGVGGPDPAPIGEVGTGAGGVGHAFIVKSADNPAETHSTQFFVKANTVLQKGDVCKLSFKYKADKAAESQSQTHTVPGTYIFYDAAVSVNFTTEWQTFEKEFTVTEAMVTNGGAVQPFQTIAWNLAVSKVATTYYFDDVEFCIQRKGNVIPMEHEEKVKKLTDELERWIKGMMEACGGYVTAWDVVNEPISGGGNDGNGNYVLQSAVNPDDNGVGGQNFYWQDFLGDDYARIPIKFARKYFEEYGGKSEDLKLFINDYNLESWWDENKKLKSLINWIQRWESDGETKIDGIGTQMHVSYILNEADQKKQEESIVNMFKLLAASGKLVKITELDMGIVEKAFGDAILTENLTDEMQQKMSEFYKFIIQKYFEIIPVAQQYGITHWSPTDSPADSGWRKGQPIGLWDLNYNRKPVYVGFLEGLQNGAKGNSAAK